jgi:hypothetical protein
VIAFLLGSVAAAITFYAAGFVLGIVAQNGGWSSFRIAAGPLVFFTFERTKELTSTTFGPGLAPAALAGGVLNALGAGFLRRRGGY